MPSIYFGLYVYIYESYGPLSVVCGWTSVKGRVSENFMTTYAYMIGGFPNEAYRRTRDGETFAARIPEQAIQCRKALSAVLGW